MARTLEFLLGPDVKSQNAPYALARCILNRERGEQAWRFVREHWDHANAAFPNPSIVRMIDPVKTLTRPEQEADVAGFFAEHDIPQAAKTLQQVLERQRVNVALRTREAPTPRRPLHGVSRRPARPRSRSSPSSRAPCSSIVRAPDGQHADGHRRWPRRHRRARRRGRRGGRRWAGAGDVVRRAPRRPAGGDVPHAGRATRRVPRPLRHRLRPPPRGDGLRPRRRGSSCPANAATAHPVVCLRAALAELQEWGAEGLVVKGDVTHDSRSHEYELAAAELRGLPMPLWVIPGNHDGGNHRHDDGGRLLALHGITLARPHDRAEARRPPGDPRQHRPRGPRARLPTGRRRPALRPAGPPGADDDRAAPPAHDQPHPLLPAAGRPGGGGPPAARPDRWRSTRRRWSRAGTPTATVGASTAGSSSPRSGSTKDHPGTWAGYLVYEGGIVQTVRRIMDPTALAWTERAASSALGVWGRWSPGRLSDRSFTHAWPSP